MALRFLFSHKKLVFVCTALIGLLIVGLQLNADDFRLGDAGVQKLLVCSSIAICLQMIGHGLRAFKHHYLLEQIRPIRKGEVFKGQMIGLLFNTVLPFRLGELVRAHYIGKGVSISQSAVFATILFERFIDTIILALVGIVLININGTLRPLLDGTLIGMGCLIIVLGVLLLAARTQQTWFLQAIHTCSGIFNKRLRNRIRMVCWSGIYCLKNVINQTRMPRYLTLTVIMWCFYLASTATLIAGLQAGVPAFDQFIASVGAYFSVATPVGPAYISTFREIFSSVSALPAEVIQATNMAFLMWCLLFLPTSILGFIFLVRRQVLYHRNNQNTLEVLRNKLYRDTDISKEFGQFLDAYFRGDQINRILTTQELGNRFQVIKTFKGGSNALTLLAWQNDQMVVKKITLKQYEDKLRAQYQWLHQRNNLPQIAKVLGESRDDPDHYAIDIAYRDKYIPFFDVIHSSSIAQSREVLQAVYQFADKKLYKPKQPVKTPRRTVNAYIKSKAIGKVTDAANSNLTIAHLLAYDTIVVNGREILNFSAVIDAIKRHKQAMTDLEDIIESPIHGDLTIDNLIVNPATSDFILLDPNNENAISDPIVDYGKLMQSVHSGYEFLVTISSCSIKGNTINFQESRSVQYDQLYQSLTSHLQEHLTPSRYRAVLFHEAVHYTRMLTYRVAINPNTAALFYAIAVRLFNDFMEQYDAAKD